MGLIMSKVYNLPLSIQMIEYLKNLISAELALDPESRHLPEAYSIFLAEDIVSLQQMLEKPDVIFSGGDQDSPGVKIARQMAREIANNHREWLDVLQSSIVEETDNGYWVSAAVHIPKCDVDISTLQHEYLVSVSRTYVHKDDVKISANSPEEAETIARNIIGNLDLRRKIEVEGSDEAHAVKMEDSTVDEEDS